MNKKLIFLLLTAVLLVCNPKTALSGALNGLNLWFDVIVPTLLPFMIISHLLQEVYGSSIRNPVAYTLGIGIFCGFPMGAFAACSMYEKKRLTQKTAYLLLTCCNISSPAFVVSYIAMTNLKLDAFPYRILAAVYLPVLLLAAAALYMGQKEKKRVTRQETDGALSFEVFDRAVTGSIENVLKLGVYMILFSIMAAFVTLLPIGYTVFKCLLVGICEITTGIHYTAAADIPDMARIPLILAMNAFGGLSCAMQSMSFIRSAGLSVKKYMYHKILLAFLTGITWFLLAHVP
ncbi:MAG: hypothetical protein NC086_09615 [Alistipes sp.]|nr:hypothetical protein [Alistipes sp.]